MHTRIVPAVAMLASLALPAHAAGAFFDFEDGSVGSWLSATTGGSGSTGVEMHNGSQMAFAQHTGALTHSLSHDFAYGAGDLVSFDMHAVANVAAPAQAYSGVTMSFLNALNVSLGTLGIYNTTDPAGLGAHQFGVDNLQHHYGDTMSGWAALAGVAANAPVAKVGISFDAYAQRNFYDSASKVWFDNVSVAAVPEPGQWALMLAGLLATAHTAGRRRRR